MEKLKSIWGVVVDSFIEHELDIYLGICVLGALVDDWVLVGTFLVLARVATIRPLGE